MGPALGSDHGRDSLEGGLTMRHWRFTVPLRLRSLFRRDCVEQELDEELRFHVEGRIAMEIAAGRSPDEARVIVMREIGGLEYRKEECRDMRRTRPIENF